MKTAFSAAALLAATLASPAAAGVSSWDTKCGSRFDRLLTSKLSFTTEEGGLEAGKRVTLDASGATNLHGPFMGGSWSVRVYEEGSAHPVGDYFGDLAAVLSFPDAKNTTFAIKGVSFVLPPKQYTGKFQAAFTAQDFAKDAYFCDDVFYTLDRDSSAAMSAQAAVPELVLPTFAADQDPYTVTSNPGNFTVKSVKVTTRDHKFHQRSVATVVVTGNTEKTLTSGVLKYQIYETGVSSFISSGNSNYFQCNNKGCDLTKPIALKLEDTSGNPGAYTLTFQFAVPKRKSKSREFRVVFWGEDQDHSPYDFSATITFNSRN